MNEKPHPLRQVQNTVASLPRSLDFWLIVAAALLALPSLSFPFGRDQALHYYIGRFMWDGLVPFRDAFDNKPPGIYFVYALGVLLFGVGQAGIRIIELLLTIGAGMLAVAAVPGAARVRGLVGATVLLSTAYYYTIFDFWNSAQPEHFEGALLLAAWVAVLRCRQLSTAAVLSGVCSAVAVLFKTPAVLPALGIAGALAWRALFRDGEGWRWRALLLAMTLHVAAGAVIGGSTIAAFVLLGAGPEFYEGMVGYALYYKQFVLLPPGTCSRDALRFWFMSAGGATAFLAGLWLLAVVRALRKRDLAMLGMACTVAGIFALCVLSVFWQNKGFAYHWAVAAPLLSVVIVLGLMALPGRRWRIGVVAAGIALLLIGGPGWPALGRAGYLKVSVRYWFWRAGKCHDARYLAAFRFHFGFSYAENHYLGHYIRGHARAGDQLHVLGFEPIPYVIADVTSPSRFAADSFLTPPAEDQFFTVKDGVEYAGMPEWRKKHWETLWAARPRFFVCGDWQQPIHELLLQHAYIPLATFGHLCLFEAARIGQP